MRPRARELLARDGVLVIGHRGASAHAPENTLPAFRVAVEAGADLVELDTRHSADGVPVVCHDATLDRTTDAEERWGGTKLPLAARTAAELEGLDAGAWRGAPFRGTRLPTLAAALDVIQPRCTTLIERKAGDAATLMDLLARRGLSQHVVVQSFDWDFLAACRARSPDCVLGALGSKPLTGERLTALVRAGAAVVVWSREHLDAATVEAAHAAGLEVWAWTVNDEARARALRAMGVDGIITDDPARIRAALRR